MSFMRNVAAGSAAGLLLCAGTAMAQDRQPTRQPDRTNQNQDQDRMQDRTRVLDRDDYGRVRDASSPLAQIGDLSGMWDLQITYFGDDDVENARNARTSNGVAERRWILNGSVMMERYSLAGGRDTLPLSDFGQSGLRDARPLDQQDPNRANPNRTPGTTDPNRDTTRDPNRPITDQDRNRDQADRSQDRRNINDPARDRLTQGGQFGQPNQGIVLWGYDTGADEFTVVWSDDSYSGLRCDKGELGDDGRMTLTGKYYNPATEETYDTRIVIDMVSPEMQRLTMYTDAGLLSEEKKHMEVIYRRAGAGAYATPDRQTPNTQTPNRQTPDRRNP